MPRVAEDRQKTTRRVHASFAPRQRRDALARPESGPFVEPDSVCHPPMDHSAPLQLLEKEPAAAAVKDPEVVHWKHAKDRAEG